MSRERCCCNCRRNIRTKDENGHVECTCNVDNHRIGYVEVFEGWCRRWASDAAEWKHKLAERKGKIDEGRR